jgi:signal transduction histidine kinase
VSLRDVNRAALEMCESDSATRLRAELGLLFGDNEPAMLEELFVALEAGRETTETEAVLRTLRGGTKHVSVRVSALPGYQPSWSRVVVSSTDIAELHRQRAELERSNRELQQFAYVASHDLRAPLRAIDALSQWLAQDLQSAFDENQRAQMELLRGRVRRMDRLLGDLLDYARAGGEAVDVESVDVGAVLAEVIELCNVPAGFGVVTVAPLPVLETARLPLRRVLLNLIGNAIKHHDRPTGRVEVSVTPTEEHVTVRVADDGPGIPPAFHEKVFQMFQTLKPRDAVEGSGMGLALVRKLVENVGGTVWVEPNGERGAVIAFNWPRHWPRRPRRQTPSLGLRRVTPVAGLDAAGGR